MKSVVLMPVSQTNLENNFIKTKLFTFVEKKSHHAVRIDTLQLRNEITLGRHSTQNPT